MDPTDSVLQQNFGGQKHANGVDCYKWSLPDNPAEKYKVEQQCEHSKCSTTGVFSTVVLNSKFPLLYKKKKHCLNLEEEFRRQHSMSIEGYANGFQSKICCGR